MLLRTILLLLCTTATCALAQDRPLRASILEFADRWTEGATGMRELLDEAGFEVEPLGPEALRVDVQQPVDLIAFGSFVNNDTTYTEFVAVHAEDLRRFVAHGGVVLECAQSDQFGNRVTYLPEGCEVRRNDADDAVVRASLPDHTLLQGGWIDTADPAELAMWQGNEASWEGLDRWTGGQVVLAAGDPGSRRAALVEVGYGRGRFLVTSLWLDKLRGADGDEIATPEHRAAARGFGAALARYVRSVRAGTEPEVAGAPAAEEQPVGPLLGHVDDTTAHVWMRPAVAGLHTLTVSAAGTEPRALEARTRDDADRTIVWRIDGLAPATRYEYAIHRGDEELATGTFRTAPSAGTPSHTRLALGSCASSDAAPIWSTMALHDPDGLVLLGDTPYIDTTDLAAAREKQRAFLEIPELAALGRRTPIWATWDDHDFGKNDSDGRLPGKANTRRAFVDYHALASFGDGAHGIYTSFRRGPLEVFLLDTRWFARTESVGPGDDRPSLLGAAQWQWLEDGLSRSTAPFKILACGMIWDDKGNSESDDWGSFPYERERLERMLGEHGITGCVLVGGDIHVSRHLRYPDSAARVGYVLDQLIVSPLHERVIPSLDIDHPALLWSAKEPRTFLLLDADDRGEEAVLRARWVQDVGRGRGRELREVSWRAAELRR